MADGWCRRLKHEGGAAVLGALRQVGVSGRTALAREAHRELSVYFTNQVHWMDYPSYRAKGWLIGSGPVEAAYKQVVGQCLKGTGMRWGEAGADATLYVFASVNVTTSALHTSTVGSGTGLLRRTGESKTRRLQRAFAAHLRQLAARFPAGKPSGSSSSPTTPRGTPGRWSVGRWPTTRTWS